MKSFAHESVLRQKVICIMKYVSITNMSINISIINVSNKSISRRVLLDNNKKQNKQKTKNKHSLKDCVE